MSEIIQYGQAFAALENIRSGRYSSYCDDFLIGQPEFQGWVANGSGNALLASESGHPGIYQLSVSLAAGGNVGQIPGAPFDLLLSDMGYGKLVMRPSLGTDQMSFSFGFSDNLGVDPDESQQGAYFSFLPATSPNWRTVTRDGAGITVNTTAIAYTLATWYQLEMVLSAAQIDFYINGALQFSHVANIPVGNFAFSALWGCTDVVNDKIIDFDYLQLATILPLAQRF